MSNTFAEHVLGLAARGANASAAAANCDLPSRSAIGSTTGSTYASVVLLMGLGAAGATDTARAAADGAIGASSSGHVRISLTIPERIDVQGMSDVTLAQDTRGSMRGETTGCIYGRGAGQYSVAAHATNPDYELAYTAGSDAPRVLTMGAALQRLEGADAEGCAEGTSNARIALRVKGEAAALLAADSAVGSSRATRGALTLLIAPE